MNRSAALKSLRAFAALVVALLQLFGALHFSLVRHGYSAALGGVVHVHAASFARSEAKAAARAAQAPSASSDTPSCSADLCAAASAPHGVARHFEAPDAGAIAFGDVLLLSEHRECSLASRRVLLGAPKTSPPA
jgi:hypothetical protein